MPRREFMLAAVAAIATTSANAGDRGTAADFVRATYEREIAGHNARKPPDNDAFRALFTREMRRLMDAPRVGTSNLPDGPIIHALFGAGALPGRTVVLRSITTVRENAAAAAVKIDLSVLDNPRDVVAVLLRQNGVWRIDDLDYGTGETLAARYRRFTAR
jgi:hypothetical protein